MSLIFILQLDIRFWWSESCFPCAYEITLCLSLRASLYDRMSRCCTTQPAAHNEETPFNDSSSCMTVAVSLVASWAGYQPRFIRSVRIIQHCSLWLHFLSSPVCSGTSTELFVSGRWVVKHEMRLEQRIAVERNGSSEECAHLCKRCAI